MKKLFISGEQPIKNAPVIELDNGAVCIPQQYLSYFHSVSTIEDIIANCSFDSGYVVMAGQDSLGLYIQIGVIGFDTFKPPRHQKYKKMVYGRRWRIEPYFPTSELIQTIYLAIKKAREHEIRERLKINVDGKYSAPFSSHQDLPLICSQFDSLSQCEPEYTFDGFRRALLKITKKIQFDQSPLRVLNIEKRYGDQILVDIKFIASEWSDLPEICDAIITIIINKPSINLYLHELMDALIKQSDDYVADRFCYNEVPRFSKSVNPLKIAELSQRVRKKLTQTEYREFYVRLKIHNDKLDQLRVPKLLSKTSSSNVRKKLEENKMQITGYLPEI